MDTIFRDPLARGNIFIYMDDILIATDGTWEDHYKEVEQVLQTLQEHDLYLKPDKCKFHRTEIDFLEMVIGGGQVKMDQSKLKESPNGPLPLQSKNLEPS